MAFTVNPRLMTVQGWTAQMALSLYQYGPIPTLLDPSEWRPWAAVVVNIPAIAGVGAPKPERFVSWEDWAQQFNLSIRALGASP